LKADHLIRCLLRRGAQHIVAIQARESKTRLPPNAIDEQARLDAVVNKLDVQQVPDITEKCTAANVALSLATEPAALAEAHESVPTLPAATNSLTSMPHEYALLRAAAAKAVRESWVQGKSPSASTKTTSLSDLDPEAGSWAFTRLEHFRNVNGDLPRGGQGVGIAEAADSLTQNLPDSKRSAVKTVLFLTDRGVGSAMDMLVAAKASFGIELFPLGVHIIGQVSIKIFVLIRD
jgi:hypothetical protein